MGSRVLAAFFGGAISLVNGCGGDDTAGAGGCGSVPAPAHALTADSCVFLGPDGDPNCAGHCSCSNTCKAEEDHEYTVLSAWV
jgi:hypothetical protein